MPKSERNKRIDGWMDRMGRSLMSIAGRFLFLLDPCKSVCLTLVYVARLSNFLLPSILDYLPKGFSRAPNELPHQILLIQIQATENYHGNHFGLTKHTYPALVFFSALTMFASIYTFFELH